MTAKERITLRQRQNYTCVVFEENKRKRRENLRLRQRLEGRADTAVNSNGHRWVSERNVNGWKCLLCWHVMQFLLGLNPKCHSASYRWINPGWAIERLWKTNALRATQAPIYLLHIINIMYRPKCIYIRNHLNVASTHTHKLWLGFEDIACSIYRQAYRIILFINGIEVKQLTLSIRKNNN